LSNKEQNKAALEALSRAILEYDSEAAKKAAQVIIDKKIDPMTAIKEAIGNTANILHEKFESGECFLPHLVMAGDAMIAASSILESAMPKDSALTKKVVVIGTVEADLHSVGKNIVAMMLRSGGFEVHDLGVDVKSSAIIRTAKEVNADIIALSSLLTTTRPYQREVIEELESTGLRDNFKVIVGGGPVTADWAKEIGADGYGTDALEALQTAKKLSGLDD
jgi:methylmalonyl-CoA mutase cobalamin-binding domain/chain